MLKPYSLRDFRSAFHTETLRREFGGDYEIETRRWRFPSATARMDAAKFLATFPLVTAQVPGAHRWHEGVKNRHGFFIMVRSDRDDNVARTTKATARPQDVIYFNTPADRDECLRYLFSKLKADPDAVTTLEKRLRTHVKTFKGTVDANPCERTTDELIDDLTSLPQWGYDVKRWNDRLDAFERTRPHSEQERRDSRKNAVAQATEVMERILRIDVPFTADAPLTLEERRARGSVSGILAGRAPHHLAILTDDEGHGVLLERHLIATALRFDGKGEDTPERAAAIHVSFNDAGTGKATQDRRFNAIDNRDIDIGPLVLRARAASGPLGAVLEYDRSTNEDIEANIVAASQHIVAAIDDGAGLFVLAKSSIPIVSLGTKVRLGPSFTAQSRSRAR